MNEERLEGLDKFMLVTVRYGLFLVLLLPFLVFREYLYPWVTGKIWGLEILVSMLFPLYVFLAVRRREYRPSTNNFFLAVLIFFVVATISMLLGDNIDRSFWSKPDRQTGMFFQYHLLAFFVMAGALWRGQARKVIIAATGVAVILAIHGMSQAYLGEGGRGSATLGNPSYLGQFLAANVFLAGWLVYHDRLKRLKWIWVIAAVIIALGIMATRSRGALAAIGAATLFAGIVLAWKARGSARKWGRRALVGIIISVAIFFTMDAFGPTHEWLYRQRLAPQYWQESTGSRVLLLKNATKGFLQRPVLGWGPENFESAFYFNYAPETLRFSQYETRQDRPHNIVLDLLNSLGIIGFLAFASVYLLGWKRLVEKNLSEHGERLFLMLATVALLTATLFIFDTPASYLLQYVLLALIMATTTKVEAQGEDAYSKWGGVAALAAGILVLWSLFAFISPTIEDSKRAARLILSLQHEVYDAVTFEEEIIKLIESGSPYAERNLRAIASNISREPGTYLKGPFLPVLERLGQYHIERFEKNKNDFVHALVSSVVLLSQQNRDTAQQDALEEAIARMHALSPNRQEVIWIDAEARIEKGELDLAEQSFLQAIELDSEIDEAHARYVRFLLLFGRVDAAFDYLDTHRDILAPGSQSAQTVSRSLALLYDQQAFDTLGKIYEASIAYDLETVEWALAGIVSAAAEGDMVKMRQRAEDTIVKFPEREKEIRAVIEIAEKGGITPQSNTP